METKTYKPVTEIPIYSDCVELISLSIKNFQNVNIFLQNNLVRNIIAKEIKILELIIHSYLTKENKSVHLSKIPEIVESIKVEGRIMFENSKLSKDVLSKYNELLNSIQKQCVSWLNRT